MLKSEACRRIAEKLEPGVTRENYICDKAFWYTRRSFGKDAKWELHSVDFFTDEEASANLLEAMPSPVVQHLMTGPMLNTLEWFCAATVSTEEYDLCGCDHGDYPSGHAHHPDRKTAIVLAACKWLGIEGELED
jgi:hypothetical protein